MKKELNSILTKYPHILEDVLAYARLRCKAPKREQMWSTHQVYERYRHLEELTHEELHLIVLDGLWGIRHEELLSTGDATNVPFDPKYLLKRLIELEAGAFLIVHNHPIRAKHSSTPSPEDIESARQFDKVARQLDFCCLRVIVIGAGEYSSFVPLEGREDIYRWKADEIPESWKNPWEGDMWTHLMAFVSPADIEALGHPVSDEAVASYREAVRNHPCCHFHADEEEAEASNEESP